MVAERGVATLVATGGISALDAQVEQAAIAGALDVAMDLEALVDRLSTIGYLASIACGLPVEAGRPLACWKASLAAAAGTGGCFLLVVARRWEQDHRTNDLQDDVDLVFDAATGALLLTPDQAAELCSGLEALDLRGTVAVEYLGDETSHIPGGPIALVVGGHDLILGADATRRPLIDPAAAAAAPDTRAVLGAAYERGRQRTIALIRDELDRLTALVGGPDPGDRPDPIRSEIARRLASVAEDLVAWR